MFDTLLVADRGETAVRVIRTARELGLRTVTAHVDADGSAPHVRLADASVRLGPASENNPNLTADCLLRAAEDTGAGAILPGGALSADPALARRCEEAGMVFVGPTSEQLELFGARHTARTAADAAGLPLAPGTEVLAGRDEALREAERIGYPVLLKSTTGGHGGLDMSTCHSAAELTHAWERAHRTECASGGVYLERFVEHARHVEVPVFGDGEGLVVTFGDRDCSLRLRDRRVLEEAPAPNLPDRVRAQLAASARDLCAWVDYRSAGTVEFLYDAAREQAYFLEVNARFPTEHPVTEEVHGVDLLTWTLRLARGERGVVRAPGAPHGHAIEVRLHAQGPTHDDRRGSGDATHDHPSGPGSPLGNGKGAGAPTSSYNPVLTPVRSNVIAHGSDRDEALRRLDGALAGIGPYDGIETHLELVRAALTDPAFREATHSTATLASLADPTPYEYDR